MKSFWQFAICSTVLFPWLTGCGDSALPDTGHPLPEPPRIAKCEPGKRGGRLNLSILRDPLTFNPLMALDGSSDAVVRLLFGTLVNLDMAAQEAEPGLAESWSVTPDGKTWTFKLRKNLRWSDGQPLTADDVVFTWNDVMYNPQYNRLTYELFRTGGKNFAVTKVDDLTIQVVTPEVFAPFVEYFGCVPILPRHVLEQPTRDKKFLETYHVAIPPEKIVGAGPYVLTEFRQKQFVRLTRNPEYWAADSKGQRLPYFDEVQLNIVNTPSQATDLFLDGKSDIAEAVRRDDWPQYKRVAGKEFQMIEFGPGVERDFFWFNQNTGNDPSGKPLVDPEKLRWFRNKKFRQAMSCAIDRTRLIQEVYNGRGQAVYGFISSENKKWNKPDLKFYEYDVDQAKALLGEIGMRLIGGILVDGNGRTVEFTLFSNVENPARGKAATMIQEDLKKLGIRVNYQPVDFPALLMKVNQTFDYECALMGLGGGGFDPASQMNVLRSSEPLHQWFPYQKAPSTEWEARIDSLMDAQMHALDFEQRKKNFDQVQEIWAEELPMLCIAAPFFSAAANTRVGNLRPSLASGYHLTWNIEELYFKK